MTRWLLPLAVAIALSACASSDDAAKTAAQDAPPPKTVLDPQLKALQKAKDVQKTVDQQKADTDKAIDDNGG
jgi:hypothetical protein